MFELFAIGVDLKMGLKKAMFGDSSITIEDVNKNVDTFKDIVNVQVKIHEIEERRNIVLDEMNWRSITQESEFDEDG